MYLRNYSLLFNANENELNINGAYFSSVRHNLRLNHVKKGAMTEYFTGKCILGTRLERLSLEIYNLNR